MNTSKKARFAWVVFIAAIFVTPAWGESLPAAINCYQESTQSKDIDAYMACFVDNPTIIDVSRTLVGKKTIRQWAIREVMPQGDSFRHLEILEQESNYAKTYVKWMVWQVHYYYWWDDSGKITKMSLQYAD